MNRKAVVLISLTACMLFPQLASAAKVLEYLFKEPAATRAVDTSGKKLDGAFTGSDIHIDFSLAGHGYGVAMNGVDEFINVGDANPLDVKQYTLMAWIRYAPTAERNAEIMEKAAAYWLNIRTDTRVVRAGGFFGKTCKWIYTDSPVTVAENTWSHVASAYNGKQLKIYINGQLAKTAKAPGGACVNSNPLAVGAKYVPSNNVTANFVNGMLDDVRVFNNALTAAQIQGFMLSP